MFGWLSVASTRASRSKRRKLAESPRKVRRQRLDRDFAPQAWGRARDRRCPCRRRRADRAPRNARAAVLEPTTLSSASPANARRSQHSSMTRLPALSSIDRSSELACSCGSSMNCPAWWCAARSDSTSLRSSTSLAAGLLEKRGAMLRRELECGVVQIAGSLISLGIHQAPPWVSSRYSQACARLQSRRTVPTDTLRTCATSLRLRPAEEAKLDHSAMARVQRLQRRKRIVQGHQIGALRDAEVRDVRK